ncbi:MAG: amino acid ABC transporter permease [Deinococcales bacterium]
MTNYHWDFGVVFANFNVLVRGLGGTFELAILALLAGFALGLPIGALRYAKSPLANLPASAFIEVFRNTPVLVQIIWFYYAFPVLIGQQLSPFTAASLALGLNTAANAAEIFRGGIQSIERGQWEAGRALGMSYFKLMRRIIIPQAIKRMIPAFTNRGIELTKMTTLASTIAFAELLYQGHLLSSNTFRPLEIYTVIAAMYFLILAIASYLVGRIEVRMRQAD